MDLNESDCSTSCSVNRLNKFSFVYLVKIQAMSASSDTIKVRCIGLSNGDSANSGPSLAF